jgi:hypothetical protein
LAVLVGAALVLLTACNPLTKSTQQIPAGWATAAVAYTGPPDAWLEVAVAGTEGYDVSYEVLVWLEGERDRSCRDAATGAVEPCQYVDSFVTSDTYPATPTRRATVSPLDGDEPLLTFTCRQGGAEVTCPELQVTFQTVDDDGDLVGDLADADGFPHT